MISSRGIRKNDKRIYLTFLVKSVGFIHIFYSIYHKINSGMKDAFLLHHLLKGNTSCFGSMNNHNRLPFLVYDRDLWFRLFEIAPFEKIPKVLYYYRVLPHSLSHGNSIALGKELLLAATMGIRDAICRNKGYLQGEEPNII
ncbi:hypothetical protein [Neobacillus drentensis]|uniref:hypothetical protein n=1 Tax=Neobacillus drentensis TaxID=220684 RepID=UPI003002212D